jgi:hypothetical protein
MRETWLSRAGVLPAALQPASASLRALPARFSPLSRRGRFGIAALTHRYHASVSRFARIRKVWFLGPLAAGAKQVPLWAYKKSTHGANALYVPLCAGDTPDPMMLRCLKEGGIPPDSSGYGAVSPCAAASLAVYAQRGDTPRQLRIRSCLPLRCCESRSASIGGLGFQSHASCVLLPARLGCFRRILRLTLASSRRILGSSPPLGL